MAGMMAGAPQAPQKAPGDAPQAKIQTLLVLQPLRLLYQPDKAKLIVAAATKTKDPAKVIAAAALAAVSASAKAGNEQIAQTMPRAQIAPAQIGNAVIQVIQALAALLVSAHVITPNQVVEVVQKAVQLAQQQGQGAEAPQPGPPGPGGAPEAQGPAGPPSTGPAGGPAPAAPQQMAMGG